MKKINMLILTFVGCLATLVFSGCDSKEDVNDPSTPSTPKTYHAEMSFSFQAKGDLPDICSSIDVWYRTPKKEMGDARITDLEGCKWGKAFTSNTFPTGAGFEVMIALKSEMAEMKDMYTIAYSYNCTMKVVCDNDGSVAHTKVFSNSPSVTVPKDQVLKVIGDLNLGKLQFYYILQEDGTVTPCSENDLLELGLDAKSGAL